MKNHPPIFILVPLIVIACYLGWSLATSSVRVRGIKDPISRQDSPREYWYYMRIFLVILAIIVAGAAWMYL
jgi:uncharacterized membrane protein